MLDDLLKKIPENVKEYLRIEGRLQILKGGKELGLITGDIDEIIAQNKEVLRLTKRDIDKSLERRSEK